MIEFEGYLRIALMEAGMDYSGIFHADGKLHRFSCDGEKDNAGWYVLFVHSDVVVGKFGCWRRNINVEFCSRNKSTLTAAEWKEITNSTREAEKIRCAEQAAAEAKVKAHCEHIFRDVPVTSHPYAAKKGIKLYGHPITSHESSYPGWLEIPLQDETGIIHSAQLIAPDGTKRFLFQGRVAGCFMRLPGLEEAPLVICEGYATGCSIHEATGWEIACTASCGNLMAVSKRLRAKNQDRIFILCSDNDQFTKENPGLTKAKEAAKEAGCHVCWPEFGDEALSDKPTDFNDLHQTSGLSEVKSQIMAVIPTRATAIGHLERAVIDDPRELIRSRYLSECGSLLLQGPTGIGKSSFLMQMFALFSNGLPFFDMVPRRTMECLIIQAENDDGDLSEMRDGICTSLKFNQAESKRFFEHVHFHTSNGITGARFCKEVISPLLSLQHYDFYALDPMLAFLGGDAKEQKVVGEFLRIYLNPLTFYHKNCCVACHHTNKPFSGKEKPNWVNGELAYLGSGSAEWANWARAILSIQSCGKTGQYKLHAAKRGSRLGWKDCDGLLTYEKRIAWSKEEGIICWREADEDEIEPDGESGHAGRPPKASVDQVFGMLNTSQMTTGQWVARAKSELDISESTFHRIRRDLLKDGKIISISDQWRQVIPSP